MSIHRSRLLAALIAILVSACALAYEIGGHHFTLVRIFLDADKTARTVDDERYVELFCAELPDLAMELDAITQREKVAVSSEWQWGLFGRCTGPVTRHMFATQYYLHGLTGDVDVHDGKPLDDHLRNAVQAIVTQIKTDRLAASGPDKLVLACARGFAAHLLGDSFAHSQLYKAGHRYPPGTGHWTDGHDPDYLLSRELMGIQQGQSSMWMNSASQMLMGLNEAPKILQDLVAPVVAAQKMNLTKDYGEASLVDSLISKAPEGWKPFNPKLNSLSPKGIREIIIDATCDERIQLEFLGEQNASRMKCNDIWGYYLKTAIKAFRDNGIDPVANAGYGSCDAGSEAQALSRQ